MVNTDRRLKIALEKSRRDGELTSSGGVAGNKFSSVLPEVYAGHPLRIERYTQYDQMDMDSEVNAALDTIADFCTQKDENTGEIFEIVYNGSQSDTEVEILKTCLRQWSKMNEFNRRFWRIFRSTLKYGDQFFIRDPETLKWYWVEQTMVEKILVNEANGKEPEAYLIRNLNLNSTNLTATQSQTYGNNMQGAGTNTMNQFGGAGAWGSGGGGTNRFGPVTNAGGRYSTDSNQLLTAVDATHVVHLSLSEGLDANWPFGISILESVFKTFRQKELLEDAVIIYRIIRAPERRIFYIDTGQMPPHKAGAYIEKVKNEIYQKRIPSRTGGSSTMADAAYSPMCLDMSTKIPLVDGRTLSISELANEYKSGKMNVAISIDPRTGVTIDGPISWAGVTQHNAQVIKLHFSNNTNLICTPDHKFPLYGGDEIKACKLTPQHKLISHNEPISLSHIEELDSKQDVGTLSIDQECHNFVIKQGVCLKNSMIDDFFFSTSTDGRGSKVETLPGGECLALDTKIKLLDGRDLTLREIIQEFNQGKSNWVYSANPETGEIVPGPVTWAGVTRKNTQVVRLTFDNGESVVVTPDHKFPILGKGAVQAQNLEIGQSMIPLYERKTAIVKRDSEGYTQVFENASKQWIFTHRLVANYMKSLNKQSEMLYNRKFKDKIKSTVHHLDFNRYNNTPENLVFMNFIDHWNYHSDTVRNVFSSMKENDPIRYAEMRERQGINGSKALRAYFDSLSDSERQIRGQQSKKNFMLGTERIRELFATDKEWAKLRNDKVSVSRKKLYEAEPQRGLAQTAHNFKMWQEPGHYERVFENQKLKFDEVLFRQLETFFDINGYDAKSVLKRINQDVEFMNHFASLNSNLNAPNQSSDTLDKFTVRHLRMLLCEYGFTWRKFRDAIKKSKSIKKKNCRSVKYDNEMMRIIIDQFRLGTYKFVDSLNQNDTFMNSFISLNKTNRKIFANRTKQITEDNVVFSHAHFKSILISEGYSDFKDFKAKQQYHNHRLVSIEWLKDLVDTGTITVDGLNICHSHHTFALSCGIITFNSLGVIDDLVWWNQKLCRGLRVPPSYLPGGTTDNQATFNDGRTGTAYIQEYRFAKYCERLQSLVSQVFDNEFKLFVKQRGFNIDSSIFELTFTVPQHFSDFARVEKDSAMINVFTPLVEMKYFSKRYLMKRYLGMSEEEISENEVKWRQENPDAVENAGDDSGGGGGGASSMAADAAPGIDSMGLEEPGEEGGEPGGPDMAGEPAPDAGGGAPSADTAQPETGGPP